VGMRPSVVIVARPIHSIHNSVYIQHTLLTKDCRHYYPAFRRFRLWKMFEKYEIQQDDNDAKIKATIHLNFKLKLLSLGLI